MSKFDDFYRIFGEDAGQQICYYSKEHSTEVGDGWLKDKYFWQFIPKGSPVKTGAYMVPNYIIVSNSYTKCPDGAKGTAMDCVKTLYSNSKHLPWCEHFIVDDKEVWQINPDNEIIVHPDIEEADIYYTESVMISFCFYEGCDEDALANNLVTLTSLIAGRYGIPAENIVTLEIGLDETTE